MPLKGNSNNWVILFIFLFQIIRVLKNLTNGQKIRIYTDSGLSDFFNDENRLVCKSEKQKIFNLLDSIKSDIIHAHTEFALASMAAPYAKNRKIPLLMTAHTNWEELISLYIPFIPSVLARFYCRSRMRKIYNRADAVIVLTSLMEVLLNLYVVKKPIRVIPTGIDKKEFENPNYIGLSLGVVQPQLSDIITE
jgi:glycosyltransferase involved in cell wall biosynthesis